MLCRTYRTSVHHSAADMSLEHTVPLRAPR